jgi:hypothetical protein
MALSPGTSTVTQFINEYICSYEFLTSLNNEAIFLFWFIMALTLAGIAFNFKRVDITEVVLLAGLGYISFTQVRYISFFSSPHCRQQANTFQI